MKTKTHSFRCRFFFRGERTRPCGVPGRTPADRLAANAALPERLAIARVEPLIRPMKTKKPTAFTVGFSFRGERTRPCGVPGRTPADRLAANAALPERLAIARVEPLIRPMKTKTHSFHCRFFFRGERTRTSDILLPKQAP